MNDNPNEAPDTAGVVAPPPLIYAGALTAGLLAKALFPVRFLPRTVARRSVGRWSGAGCCCYSLASMRCTAREQM